MKHMKNKIIPLVSNCLIFLMMLSSIIWMFFSDTSGLLISNGWEMLKYFTVLSNILIGAVSLASFILLLINKYPEWFKILKYSSTNAVTLTLLVVLFYLGPTMGMREMFVDSLIFLHLLTPLFSIVHLLFFEEKLENPKFIFTFYAAIPMFLYGIFYLTNIAVNNGYGNLKYDWYLFSQFGFGIGIVMFFAVLLFTYGVGVLLYLGYTKIKIKTSKE